MKIAQYLDHNNKWVNIPVLGISQEPERIAFSYAKDHALKTRVVILNSDGSVKEITDHFKIQGR